MIDKLTGIPTILHEQLISLATAGIHFAVSVPEPSVYKGAQEPVTLHIYFHWNSEQGPSLYGFTDAATRELFSAIIGCSGIGPRIGLSIIKELGLPGCIKVIEDEDHKALSSVNGIGAKKAEHIVVQLKHKVKKIGEKYCITAAISSQWQTLSQALSALNYSKSEISSVLSTLKSQELTDDSFDYLMRKALSFLSQSRS